MHRVTNRLTRGTTVTSSDQARDAVAIERSQIDERRHGVAHRTCGVDDPAVPIDQAVAMNQCASDRSTPGVSGPLMDGSAAAPDGRRWGDAVGSNNDKPS